MYRLSVSALNGEIIRVQRETASEEIDIYFAVLYEGKRNKLQRVSIKLRESLLVREDTHIRIIPNVSQFLQLNYITYGVLAAYSFLVIRCNSTGAIFIYEAALSRERAIYLSTKMLPREVSQIA